MIQTGFENRVKIQELVENQVPEFILDENPKFVEFLKQYYISQEYQGAPVNILDNINEYLKLDNLSSNVSNTDTVLLQDLNLSDDIIYVKSTKGFPNSYGLIEIGNEIITYKEKTGSSFIGCIRGFSGITQYSKELTFESSLASTHLSGISVKNLSVLFLQEFYNKIKYTLLPELSSTSLDKNLNVNNFLKNTKSLYQSKGTKESFRILFNALYGITPQIIDLENLLIKPSDGEYLRKKELLFENLSPDKDPKLLVGKEIYNANNPSTFGSISEIETFTRNNKIYYKFLIFIGYDETNSESSAEFIPTSSTKLIDSISAFDQVDTLTLDSTVNFPNSGNVYYNDNKIFYKDKSINQLFGCYTEGKDYVDLDIPKKSIIISNNTYYGYEYGIKNEENKINLRLLNVITGIKLLDDEDNPYIFNEGENIYVKNVGVIIENPKNSQNKKEILSNSLIYNTSCRYQLSKFYKNSNYAVTLSKIDPSSLKVGDYVEFLERTTYNTVSDIVVETLNNVKIESIDESSGEIIFDSNLSDLNNLKEYDIRRKVTYASSSLIPLKYKNITTDIINLYAEDEDNLYVASNSLPSYELDVNLFSYSPISLSDFNVGESKYSTLLFDSELSIISGDRVYYDYKDTPIPGLERGYYYIKVFDNYKKIKLYLSRSFIDLDKFIYFGSLTANITFSDHTFTLISQYVDDVKIYPQKVFKKFDLKKNQLKESGTDISTETIGILANGVEILSYKSKDKIYYGPLESIEIINSGENYDVINPPKLQLSSGSAKIQPIVTGSIKEILIDPHEFSIKDPILVSVSGGNGKNLLAYPVIRKKSRDVFFDARILEEGGGLSIDSETITFLTDHNFTDGQKIIYDINNINNKKIGIGSYFGSNLDTGNYIGNNSEFYAKVINSKTVRLYPSISDFVSGINTVGFTTVGNFGIHKFKTEPKLILDSVKIINGGSGFSNKKLIVKQSGISTYFDTISFKDHGFSTGEIITYDYETSPVIGLSTSVQYQVLKVDDDSFRLCDIGIGGTNGTTYLRKKYQKLYSSGEGYQYFSYPEITVSIKYSKNNQEIKEIIATPVVKGGIERVYLYETGSNYGSNIVNLETKPEIKILTGENAQITPVISNGKIINAVITYAGINYHSIPELVIDTKSGIGAKLRCEIKNGKISNVVVLSQGYNYKAEDTSIRVISSGKNLNLNPKIRGLTLNNSYKYGIQKENYRDPCLDLLYKTKSKNLQYVIIGYSDKLKSLFNTDPNKHSKIIGWAYDGNPIYGPYGYSNPTNTSSPIKLLTSGYTLQNIYNRPDTDLFPLGYFVDDYIFSGNGDLDYHNGRFCKTPEFPNGTYAYFATSTFNPESQYIGVFPYFIGLSYRSDVIKENTLPEFNQRYDFKNSKLLRNTLPYKSSDLYSNYEFFDQSLEQICTVNSISNGDLNAIKILNKGKNYKVKDLLYFENQDDSGYGLNAYVSEIEGEKIDSIVSNFKSYENAKFYSNGKNQFYVKYLPNFDIQDSGRVRITGLSTNYSNINKLHNIRFKNFNTKLSRNIPFSNAGIITDISVQSLPSRVSIGSSIKIIGNSFDEYYTILNYYRNSNTLKVKKTSLSGFSTEGSLVTFLSDIIIGQESFSKTTEIENYPRYFNPKISLGIGTFSGTFDNKTFYIGISSYNISIPTQSIYLPDHGFKTNQKVILKRPSATAAILVQENSNSSPFNLLGSGETEKEVYVISKTKDIIGIVTSQEKVSNTNGLYFPNLQNAGSDNYEYSLNTTFDEVLCNVENLISTVSISTIHNLNNGDLVKINLLSNQSVGIGSTSIKLKYFDNIKSLVVKSLYFEPADVNISNDTLNIVNHGLNNGDLVYYISTSIISGLSTDLYYINKLDKNNIRLSETYTDSVSQPPIFINLGSIGIGTQELHLIYPEINVTRNDNLIFDLSDSSLTGYELKLYHDKDFKNEFLFIRDNENSYALSGFGTPGISTVAYSILKYDDNLPTELYYTLKNGTTSISPLDTVKNSSKISFINSVYSNEYNIFNVTDTKFDIYLDKEPERDLYLSNDCSDLSYTTTSENANGPVSKISISDKGNNYIDLPYYKNSSSKSGDGLLVIPQSNSIGKLNGISLKNNLFEYSSDNTLLPAVYTPFRSDITNSNILTKVSVVFGGKNYPSAPELVVIDSQTKQEIKDGLLKAEMSGKTGTSNIRNVLITTQYTGLPSFNVEVKAVNNSNGIIIDKVTSSTDGVITCLLKTPILGFPKDPFTIGEDVFVENIENISETGIGFNSKDHGYQFFKVIGYDSGSNPGKIVIKIPELYGNPGVAVTFQLNTLPSIIKKSNYPIFETFQEFSTFSIGESLSVVNSNGSYTTTDLVITKSTKNYIKYIGKYKLSIGDIVRGSETGYKATIQNLSVLNSSFTTNGLNEKSYGWGKETGQIGNDLQYIPDNDYYQSLSYTIKSPKTWNETSSIVNSVVHPIGTKNFVDTQITTSGIVTAGSPKESYLDIIRTYISQSRVDVIKNFDLTTDAEVLNNKSNLIKFKNIKLIDYFESRTNRVLKIDDISGQFSSSDDDQKSLRKIIRVLSPNQLCTKFKIQVKSSQLNFLNNNINELQFIELIAIRKKDNVYYLEKNSLANKTNKLVDVKPIVDEVNNYYLEFVPVNPYEIDYEIKILTSEFSTTSPSISSTRIGSIDIFNNIKEISANSNQDILSLNSTSYNSLYSEIHVFNKKTLDTEYIELYAVNDDQNVYYSDYYFNSNNSELTYGSIGSFGLTVLNGVVKLNCFNKIDNSNIIVSTKTIAFHSTSGIGTYRFKSSLQSDQSERTIIYESNTKTVSSASTIASYNRNLFSTIKSIINVSIGNTFSLHQIAVIQDSENSNLVEYPMILSGDNIGIGTFGSSLDSNNININFYPSQKFNGSNIKIKYFNEVFYTFLDELNVSLPFSIKPLYESFAISKYYGLNSRNVNRLNFNLNYNSIPIFAKTFDPNDPNILDPNTGIFTIHDHYFSTGEKLIYKPKSSFIGVGQSAMGIVPSLDDNGISTSKLPTTVYAIKIDNDHFKVSTNKQNSLSNIGVVFTNLGVGNAHMFEMEKKNEKTIITINNLIQYPITYSNITHYLSGNNGAIGVGNTFFTLTGISSIRPADLIKINDEYMKVLNVGIGTSNSGPILFFTGNKNIVEVERGFVGSSATSHLDGSAVSVYRGSYNISEDQIYFTHPPRGNVFDLVLNDERNLPRARAKFTGRVFLRQDYTSNVIFDDISDQFTGVAQTFSLKRQGISTVGLGTTAGNGIVLINGIYQTPLTENINNYNFKIVENQSIGISSVIFSGIKDELDNIAISESDVNKNQLPRGGIIVSLGSTAGLGYAPLVGANIKALLNNNGSIVNVAGVATIGSSVAFTTVSYNNVTGILDVYTPSTYSLRGANQVKLVGLAFTCPSNPGIVSYFPSHNSSLDIVGVGTTSFSVQVGTSTLPHYYVGYGTVYPWYETLSFGSGYNGKINVEVFDESVNYTHRFINSKDNSVQKYPSGALFTPSYAVYSPLTGILTLTIKDHGLTTSDKITINTESIVFSCSSDNYTNEIAYPRVTDPIVGIPTSIISYTNDTISVGVGSMVGSGASITAIVNDGGILSFNIVSGGIGYVDPIIKIPSPSYQNLPIRGISRLGIGTTTDTGIGLLMNVEVGPASNNVGIGSTLFEVTSFKITRTGYNFRRGDVFTPVGLVTAKGLNNPVEQFKLYVLETYNDSFASWQFGELNLLDSIKKYQDGKRYKYPLYYNGDLLSFQKSTDNPDSQLIDFDSLLVIFINGILQEPGFSYEFNGGSSMRFITPPKENDLVEIYFYVGTRGIDSTKIEVDETIKIGDTVQIYSNNGNLKNTVTQNSRTVFNFQSADLMETNIYSDQGVDDINLKPLFWTKQKEDLIINDTIYSKARDSIEPQVYPTSRIIKDFSKSDTELFVDDASIFNYEGEFPTAKTNLLIVPSHESISTGIVTAIVSTAGTIKSLSIVNSGFGYTGTPTIKISNPYYGVGVGVGSTAVLTIQSQNLALSTATIVSPGFGYTYTNPPQVIISNPQFITEQLKDANVVQGFSGSIIGIGTTSGIGTSLALKFEIKTSDNQYDGLEIGYPIYIFDTKVGYGVTSIDKSENQKVGISTQYLDNVYYVHNIQNINNISRIITCNISEYTNTVGISTGGLTIGKFSWGRISGFIRSSNPISIGVSGYNISSGLSTYPSVQRRGYGLRKTGALKKQLII